jgi:hypothetical protein
MLRKDGAIVELLVGNWELAVEGTDKSFVRAAVTSGPERGKLKIFHC